MEWAKCNANVWENKKLMGVCLMQHVFGFTLKSCQYVWFWNNHTHLQNLISQVSIIRFWILSWRSLEPMEAGFRIFKILKFTCKPEH